MTKLLSDKIKVKARWTSRHYPELKFDDLVQEGCALVLELKNKLGDKATIPYLLQAISYHYSHLIRKSNAKRKIKFSAMSNAEYIPDPTAQNEFNNVEDNIDREKFMESIEGNKLLGTLHDLMDGYDIKEVAERQRTSVRSIYRQVKILKTMREKWEK